MTTSEVDNLACPVLLVVYVLVISSLIVAVEDVRILHFCLEKEHVAVFKASSEAEG